MALIKQKPPKEIYDKCVKQFGADFEKGTIFAYDGDIYSKYDLEPHKLIHEAKHLSQQKELGSADNWWTKYFLDDSFRLEQEIEAYLEENHLLKKLKDRNLRAIIIHENATALSSKLYGNIISYTDAKSILSKGLNLKR